MAAAAVAAPAVAAECCYGDSDDDALIAEIPEEDMKGGTPPGAVVVALPPVVSPLPKLALLKRIAPEAPPQARLPPVMAPPSKIARREEIVTGPPPTFRKPPVRSLDGCLSQHDADDDAEGVALSETQQAIVDAGVAGLSFYITGLAGTGKSVAIRCLIKKLRKMGRAVFVTAPTGIAASNVNGTTIHSFAGLKGESKPPYPLGYAEAQDRIRCADVLFVDEVSMVSNHMMDGLNVLCRQIRDRHTEDFGGIQVIVCGDFGQIQPVDDGGKQDKLRNEADKGPNEDGTVKAPTNVVSMKCSAKLQALYDAHLTPRDTPILPCFTARCWKRMFLNSFIQLHTIYRQQSDDTFRKILLEVRNGCPTATSIQLLRNRHVSLHPELCKKGADGIYQLPDHFVVLYPRCKDAEAYNLKKLRALKDDTGFVYKSEDYAMREILKALISKCCQLKPEVRIKVDCRVVLKKNFTSGSRALVNGSMGTVIGFTQIFVLELDTKLARPVEDAIMGHAMEVDADVDPYHSGYTTPRNPLAHVGNRMDVARFRPGVRRESICSRELFNNLCDSEEGQQAEQRPSGWLLLPKDKRDYLRSTVFHPLPVVQFDNGEVVVILPSKWSLEDTIRQPHPLGNRRPPDAPAFVYIKRIIASRWQLPLLLAWSLSIHSSQGLTIRNLCVDVGGGIFGPGMAYVALSRAVSLEGLLIWDINPRKLEMVNPMVVRFYEILANKERAGTGRPALKAIPAPAPAAPVAVQPPAPPPKARPSIEEVD